MSLSIQRLSVTVTDREILREVSLDIHPGELHLLMGPNGSGKSTLAHTLMGNPAYQCERFSRVTLDGKNLLVCKVEERSDAGLFLAFQSPVAIPGVSVAQLLRQAVIMRQGANRNPKKNQNPALSVWDFNKILLEKALALGIQRELLGRSLNEDFSGGEKKKLEMLQAIILMPKYAVFDEVDTGLDVDAMKTVAKGINLLRNQGTGCLVITHLIRFLRYVLPDRVHIMAAGRIAESGGKALIREVDKSGYGKWMNNH